MAFRVQIAVLTSRTLRRLIARLLIGAMLFAQLATVAHACTSDAADMRAGFSSFDPGLSTVSMAGDGSADTAPMAAAQPNLCAAHCQSAGQNVSVEPMATPPFALLAGYFTLDPVLGGVGLFPPVTPDIGPPPPGDPPHATLHCCLRI